MFAQHADKVPPHQVLSECLLWTLQVSAEDKSLVAGNAADEVPAIELIAWPAGQRLARPARLMFHQMSSRENMVEVLWTEHCPVKGVVPTWTALAAGTDPAQVAPHHGAAQVEHSRLVHAWCRLEAHARQAGRPLQADSGRLLHTSQRDLHQSRLGQQLPAGAYISWSGSSWG